MRIRGDIQNDRAVDAVFVHAAKEPGGRPVGIDRNPAACVLQRFHGAGREAVGEAVRVKVDDHGASPVGF